MLHRPFFLLLFLCCILTLLFTPTGKAFWQFAASPFVIAYHRVLDTTIRFFDPLENQKKLEEKYTAIVKEHATLLARIGTLEYVEAENITLRRQLQVPIATAPSLVGARVIACDNDDTPKNLLIKHNAKDDIAVGSAVLLDGLFIGTVQEVDSTTATVSLLWHKEHPFPVSVGKNGVRGIVSATDSGLFVTTLPHDSNITPGDTVVTDISNSPLFPAGVMVGTIGTVINDTPWKRATLIPATHPRNARVVFVVTKENKEKK